MKFIIDLQACQSPASRNRGIGRYSHSLAQAVARQAGKHDLWLFLTEVHSDGIESIRQSFDGLVPNEKIIVWRTPALTSEFDRQAIAQRLAVEAAREAFLASLNPDFVHVSSLFETHDNCITSIGHVDPRPKTAVTLYDLIPLVHKETYLSDDNARWWYMRKIEQLKKADLLFAISEHSRKEAIEHLSISESSVATIWGAADPQFKKNIVSVEESAIVRGRYGLVKPFLMYTGGIDHRKNMEGLISAYARLPGLTRSSHQLAIVCKVSESERENLINFSAKQGLEPNELVITGYVPETDLVVLYNICELFVFPSWHEGFGLPILEAMACGAPVIAANATSLPEIVGRSDALFNPRDLDSISAKMQQALTDPAFRRSLVESGLERAQSFTWENTAKITLAAVEEKCLRAVHSGTAVLSSSAPVKPRLAYVSPMPPERTGIAGYSADLLPSLARHFEIDVVVDQPDVDPKALPQGCSLRNVQWFREHGSEFTHIVYHFGNSLFHRYMYDLLREHPGIVVLHDFFLSGPPAHLELSGEVPGMWGHTLFDSHGYRGIRDVTSTHDYLSIIRKYPCNLEVLRLATGVIVHSEYSAKLAREWYGENATHNWKIVPLQRVHQHIGKEDARIALGIGPDIFLVCAFGSLARAKLNDKLLDGWLHSPLAGDKLAKLIFVGEHGDPTYAAELDLQLKSSHESVNNISITGFADYNNYALYLAAADIGVQLRGFSRGETSGAALDCMAYGLPVIVNIHAAMAELPTHAVVKIPDLFSRDQLVRALVELKNDPVRREILSYESFNWIKRNHSPDGVSDIYRNAIIEFSKNPKSVLRTLFINESEATSPLPNWRNLASKSLYAMAPAYGAKQIFVDISVLVNINAGTGIQRVTIGLLKAMLLNPLPGIRIEPVYMGAEEKFWYARRFCVSFMEYGYSGFALGLKDEPIQVHVGDIFLGLDLVSNQLSQKKKAYQSIKDLGGKLCFVVYDLLPYFQRQWFQKEDAQRFSAWLAIVNEIADEILCISNAVANEFLNYQKFNVNAIAARKLAVREFQVGTAYANGRHHRQSQRNAVKAGLDAMRRGREANADPLRLFDCTTELGRFDLYVWWTIHGRQRYPSFQWTLSTQDEAYLFSVCDRKLPLALQWYARGRPALQELVDDHELGFERYILWWLGHGQNEPFPANTLSMLINHLLPDENAGRDPVQVPMQLQCLLQIGQGPQFIDRTTVQGRFDLYVWWTVHGRQGYPPFQWILSAQDEAYLFEVSDRKLPLALQWYARGRPDLQALADDPELGFEKYISWWLGQGEGEPFPANSLSLLKSYLEPTESDDHVPIQVPLQLQSLLTPAEIETREIEAKFLLVGTIEPRKGHAQTLDAFEILWTKGYRAQLVIVGRPGWMTEQLCLRIQEHAEFGHRLKWHKDLPDDRLPEFYQTSTALILASFGEGLGMPLLEAAAFGLPVIARDIPVFREIAGSAAEYFNGDDGETLSKTVETWLHRFALGNVIDSFSIDTIGWDTSANQVMTLLGISDAGQTSEKTMKRVPYETERAISFGRALDNVYTGESTAFSGTIGGGTEVAELVVGLERQDGGQNVLVQETVIPLQLQASSLEISFEFRDIELFVTVGVGNVVKTLRTFRDAGYHVVKLLLRTVDHNVLYEYKLPIESAEKSPRGRLRRFIPHDLPVENGGGPTIRLCAPTIISRDAVGQYCRNTADFLANQGFSVQIYADNFDLNDFDHIRKYSELFEDIGNDDVIILVYSIFDPFLRKLSLLPNKKMVMFQNVTPADMLERWDPSTAIVCAASTAQFEILSKFDKVYASTRYTALILQAFFKEPKSVDLIPPIYSWQYPNLTVNRPSQSTKIKLLFVGRVVPNKRIDDLIKMYFEFLKFEWEATLTLVGSNWSKKYREYLDNLVTELGFSEGQVNFVGSVSDAELMYHYQTSTAYVSLSEHEGYCIPMVEAMRAELPVFAYSHPAVSEVLGDAGVKIADRELWEWGERISLVLKDKDKVKTMVEKQNERVKIILKSTNGDELLKGLRELNLNVLKITEELKPSS